jgi:transposase
MNIDKNTLELIYTLEYIIGSQCKNTKAIKSKKGDFFRFPLSHRQNKKCKTFIKEREELEGISESQLRDARYVFGSNQLYIGEGIIKVLEELENRYGLNYVELEKERTKRRKVAMKKIEKEITKESEAEIDSGKYECGLDIQEGKYIITSDEDATIKIWRSIKSKRKNKELQLKNNSKETIMLDEGDILDSNVMLLIRH